MRKHLQFALMLAALFVPWAVGAQDTFTYGEDASETTMYTPFRGAFTDYGTQSETIFPASELEDIAGSVITSLTFYTGANADGDVSWVGATFTVKLEEVSANTASGSAWASTNDASVVYTGALTVVNHQMVVNFDEPFQYNGGNLAMTFNTGGGATWHHAMFLYGSTGTPQVAYVNRSSGSGPYSPATPSETHNQLPKCTFVYTPTGGDFCMRPRNLETSEVTAYGATLSWQSRENASQYIVYLNGEEVETTADTFYVFEDLNPATTYTLGVSTLCNSGDTSGLSTTQVTTSCVLLTHDNLPLFQDFNNSVGELGPCWQKINLYVNGSYDYPWPISTQNHGTGAGQAVYFYVGDGQALNYAILPPVDDLNGLMLSFWSYVSNPSTCQLQVGTMSDPTDVSTFSLIYSTPSNMDANTWYDHEVVIPEGTTDQYLAIRNNGSNYNIAYLDDVTLMLTPSCVRPTSVAASAITDNSATITINDPTEVGDYLVTLQRTGAADSVFTTNDTEFQLEGLLPNTPYTVAVASVCPDDGNPTSTVSYTFLTLCGAISTLPWVEGFETYANNFEPECYNHPSPHTSNMNTAFVYSTPNHSGSKSFRFNYSNGDNVLVLPPFEAEISTLEMSFWSRPESISNASCGTLKAGYVTDPNNPSTFVATFSVNYNDFTSAEYREDYATFAGAPEGALIAFCHTSNTGSNWYWQVDDIDVHVAPDCARPSIIVSDVTDSSALVTLTDPNDAGTYSLTVGNGTAIEVSASDNPYLLEGLNPDTEYSLSAVTVCDDATTTAAVSANFRTLCGYEPFPWHFTQANMYAVQSPGFSSCWDWTNFYRSSTGGVGYVYSSAANSEFRLPAVDVDLSTAQLRTLVATTAANSRFCVGVREGNSTVWLDTISVAQTASSTDGLYYEVSLAAYTGTSRRVVVGNVSGTTIYHLDFHVEPIASCPAVANLHADQVLDTGATISWQAGADESQWLVYLNDTEVATVNAPTYTFDQLTPATAYTISVRTFCAEGDTSSARSISIRTACALIHNSQLPLEQDFQSSTASMRAPDCWSFISSASYPQVYTASSGSTVVDGETVGGLVYYFYTFSTGEQQFLVTPPIENIDGLAVSCYDYQISNGSQIAIGVMSDPTDPTTFQQLTIHTTTSSWTAVETTVSGIEDIENYHYIAFRSSMLTGNGGCFIDNIVIGNPNGCDKPQNLAVANVTENSADISWTGEADQYEVTLSDGSNEQVFTVTDNSLTFSTLSGSSAYTVTIRAICDDDVFSRAATTSFRTLCSTITELPWTEDFSSYSTSSPQLPDCWDYESSSSNSMPYVSSNGSTAGNMPDGNYLCISTSSGSYGPNGLAVLPPFGYDLGSLQVKFNYCFENASHGPLYVGYVATNNYVADFVTVYTVPGSNTYTIDSVSFAGLEDIPEGARIAFYYNHNNSPYYSIGIDNIVVSLADTSNHPVNPNPNPEPDPCDAPTDVTAGATTDNVTIYWTATGDYEVALANGSSWSEPAAADIQQVSASPYTWNGLVPNTTYTVGVRQVCDVNNHSDWVTRTVTTSQVGIGDVEFGDSNFELYPNPASGSVSVAGFEGQVTIVDLNGREVMTAQVGDTRTSIDISSLPAGAYFVRLTSDSATAVRKLIVR